MGAEVTVCGPPTLIPRGIEALGCEVRYTLDGLGEADVVYALRMQRERMRGPTCPRCASTRRATRSTAAACARPGADAPGPVNRGVELAAEVIDSPQALITAQVESGVVVRMAVLYELVAGAREAPADPAASGGAGREPAPARAPA